MNKAKNEINAGSIYYKVEQVFMTKYNGDERYENIKAKIEKDIPLNNKDIMDLVFLPLMKNNWGEDETARKVIELAKQIKDEEMQSIVIAAALGLADKYVRKEYLDRLKEVVKMTRIGAALIEEGVEKGRKGMVIEMIQKRFGKVPKTLEDKINLANDDTLNKVVDSILENKTLEEIEAILK